MLKQRVITAVLLLAVLVPAMLVPQKNAFLGLSLLMIAAGGWEWARLNGSGPWRALMGATLVVVVGAALMDAGWTRRASPDLWLATGAVWVVLGVWVLARGVAAWSRWPALLRRWAGLLLIVLAWLALSQAHERGVNFLLSGLAMVWAADIAAYFAGRACGGRWFSRKLAPAVSPGKTWEGALGGALGVAVVALLWTQLDARLGLAPSFYSLLWQAVPAPVALLALLFLTAMSVVGDLLESLVKRSAGVKDSSALLPGHGGVLDRVDALLPVLPLLMMWTQWLEAQI